MSPGLGRNNLSIVRNCEPRSLLLRLRHRERAEEAVWHSVSPRSGSDRAGHGHAAELPVRDRRLHQQLHSAEPADGLHSRDPGESGQVQSAGEIVVVLKSDRNY